MKQSVRRDAVYFRNAFGRLNFECVQTRVMFHWRRGLKPNHRVWRRFWKRVQTRSKWNINKLKNKSQSISDSNRAAINIISWWSRPTLANGLNFTLSDVDQIWTCEPVIRCRAYKPLSYTSSKCFLVQWQMYLTSNFLSLISLRIRYSTFNVIFIYFL